LNAGNPNRRDGTPVRAIAFYLPQYHRIPENDRWWGEGFTEWTNVRRAKPLFPGHEQPRVPGPLGYYDLTDPRVADAQAALARSHGVHGFCYYYYWFNGKRLLERPLEEMVARGTPDFPFCVCWANENWTRRWDGLDSDVLMEQRYDLDDSVRLFDEFARLFRDPRYIRVGGRPLLLVYKTTLIPSLRETVDRWRRRAAAAGVGDPYLVSCETGGHEDALAAGFDALVEFPPHRHRAIWLNGVVAGLDPAFEGVLTSYRSQVIQSLRRAVGRERLLRCVFPSWDNTPRQPTRGTVFVGSSPELFGYWAEAMIRDTFARFDGEDRLLFVNAWNEWGEGCCLEPDRRYGTQYLDALRAALERGAGPADALCAMPRWTTSGVAPPASVVAGF
jgi:lipopolysaccharide biosynthesis protein